MLCVGILARTANMRHAHVRSDYVFCCMGHLVTFAQVTSDETFVKHKGEASK